MLGGLEVEEVFTEVEDTPVASTVEINEEVKPLYIRVNFPFSVVFEMPEIPANCSLMASAVILVSNVFTLC